MKISYNNRCSPYMEGLKNLDDKDVVRWGVNGIRSCVYRGSLSDTAILTLSIADPQDGLRVSIADAHKPKFISTCPQDTLEIGFQALRDRYNKTKGKPFLLLDLNGHVVLRSKDVSTKDLEIIPDIAWMDGTFAMFDFMEVVYSVIATHSAALVLNTTEGSAYIAWPRAGHTIIHLLAGNNFDELFTPPMDVDAWLNIATKAPAVYHHAKVNYDGTNSASILAAIRSNGV